MCLYDVCIFISMYTWVMYIVCMHASIWVHCMYTSVFVCVCMYVYVPSQYAMNLLGVSLDSALSSYPFSCSLNSPVFPGIDSYWIEWQDIDTHGSTMERACPLLWGCDTHRGGSWKYTAQMGQLCFVLDSRITSSFRGWGGRGTQRNMSAVSWWKGLRSGWMWLLTFVRIITLVHLFSGF